MTHGRLAIHDHQCQVKAIGVSGMSWEDQDEKRVRAPNLERVGKEEELPKENKDSQRAKRNGRK